MLRPLLALFLVSVALAGCSSGSEPTAPEPVSSTATTTAVPVPEIVRTDTLHLVDPPHLAGTLPPDGDLIKTYVPNDLDNLNGNFHPPSWSMPLPSLALFDMDLHLWIEVEGTVTNPPRGAGAGCFWHIEFSIDHADGTTTGQTSHCRAAPQVLSTGRQVLEFSFAEDLDLEPRPGDRLAFSIYTTGIYASGAAVSLLSGTVDADSTWAIQDLQLPVDTRTLL